LYDAQWTRRQVGPRDLSERFVHLTLPQLAWTYAARAERDVLPERYYREVIYFRRAPQEALRPGRL
jgi:hypothetical protein